MKKGKNKKDLAEQLIADIRAFKAKHGCTRLVMVWAGSTEVFMKEGPVHQSLAAFEQGLEAERRRDSVAAWSTPTRRSRKASRSPTRRPTSPPTSRRCSNWPRRPKAPLAGNDMKTGQTLIKTIIAPGLKARMIGVKGWYSTNILGNRDGEVLDDPESFKTKEESKKSALDYIFQPQLYPELYKDISHVVRINYYPPRGDNKEGWDNIDIFGWLGYPMQLKINFLCRDSILAAPIVLDSALFLDLAKRAGMSRHPGMAVVLLQGADARARGLPRARPVHPADEAEEHAALPQGRGPDHAPRPRVPTTEERGPTGPGTGDGNRDSGHASARGGRLGRATTRRRPAYRGGGRAHRARRGGAVRCAPAHARPSGRIGDRRAAALGPGGGGSRFGFGAAWNHDYPRAEQHLSRIARELTLMDIRTDSDLIVALDDPALLEYPIAFMWEPGFWQLTDGEAASFRDYLLKGGFAVFEDFDGPEQWRVFEAQMRRVLPDHRLVELDRGHPIFDSFFRIKDIDAIRHPM